MRLALVLGTPDVDALLDSMTPEQFNEWLAFDLLEGVSESWRQTGEICATLYHGLRNVSQAMGAKFSSETELTAEDFIPRHPLEKKRKRKKKTISAAEDEAAMAAQYGNR